MPAGTIAAVILQTLIQGPKILAALRSGKMTEEQAEAAWDAVVAPGWKQAYNTWKETPDGRDNPVE